ncbi:MAG: DUF1492 domain-containing protein [Oscillospiraceae bacterium]|nr:DUF1492 domain-containing protein [Oscillospiraceae bacterium]
MAAKEYLQQIRDLDGQINAKLAQLDKLKTMAARASATSSTALLGLAREIDADIDRYVDIQREAKRKIDAMPNATYKLLLTLRYINGLTFEQISEEMHYCTHHIVHKLHPRALAAFDSTKKR